MVGASVVVVEVVVVDVEVVVGAAVVVEAVVVVTGGFGPQNWRLEMSGVFFPPPTFGRSLLENVPFFWAGVSVVVFEPGPPLTMIAEIGVVEVHSPPLAFASLILTTSWLPLGFSKTYLPRSLSSSSSSDLSDFLLSSSDSSSSDLSSSDSELPDW